MYIMNHGEKIEGAVDGGLTSVGKDQVARVIKKIKASQNPENPKENYFSKVVTSDLNCCIETAEIAADILNIDIDKTPGYKAFTKHYPADRFKIKVFVDSLLRGQRPNESKKEFYERVRILLSNKLINKIGNLYYSTNSFCGLELEGSPSPLLLPDDNYWRASLVISDKSMINAIYQYYCSYNPEVVELAEKELFAEEYASMFKVTQSCQKYYSSNVGRTLYLQTGTIRKCNEHDFFVR